MRRQIALAVLLGICLATQPLTLPTLIALAVASTLGVIGLRLT